MSSVETKNLQCLANGGNAVERLQELVAKVCSAGATGLWRIAVHKKHVADLVVGDGRICYVVLHGVPALTLGELMLLRQPERADEIRLVLDTAALKGQRLAETWAIIEGNDMGPIRSCLREQIGDRLAGLVRMGEVIDGQWLPLRGTFDARLTFEGDDAYFAGRDALERPVGPLRVLFVDDDPNILRAVQRVTQGWPTVIDCASTAKAAGDLALGNVYDVVVLDYVLDDANGAELAATMRTSQPSASFVLASGVVDSDELRNLAERYGIHRVMPKPFDSRVLELTLRKAPPLCST